MTAEVNRRDYSVFGLRVRSSMELPELFDAEGGELADVIIDRGPVPEAESAEPGLNAINGSLVLVVPEVGNYKISGGSAIMVDPAPGVPDRNVRLFLLGSAFGALLHQRGLLPLHANAIEIDGKAVAFMGASGAGKSTLAAWFHRHGHRVIADDVCVVRFDESGQAFVMPGLPRLRLWSEAFQVLGRSHDGLARSYVGTETYDKFDLPVGPDSAGQSATPLSAVYLLESDDAFSVAPLSGLEAAEAIFANTYRGSYVASAKPESHWVSSVRLVKTAPVFRATREWDLGKVDDQSRRLLDHASKVIAGGKGESPS